MRDELKRCKQQGRFCPVSFKSFGILFWISFSIASISAIAANAIWESPYLLGLYSFPVLQLAMASLSLPQFVMLGAGLLGMMLYSHEHVPELFLTMLTYAALLLILKRVLWISQRNYQGKNEQEESFMNTVFSLAKTIDARDPYTAFHSNNVAEYARGIARELGLPQQETDAIYLAGLIHDIGKIGTPDHILQKEGRLTDEEYAVMKRHAEDGYHIIKDVKQFQELGIADMVRYHHERPDGRGYPQGLQGTDIPLGARILGVADAFDAMTTNRSYRKKLAVETAVEELIRHSGTQFDVSASQAMLRHLTREGKLPQTSEQLLAAPAAGLFLVS